METGGRIVDNLAVQLVNLTKRYGRAAAVDDVSLEVRRGEFFSLLGPSGCGKTTTLRLIAGLAEPDAGAVKILGDDVTDVPTNKRNIGMVFQNYALFPHMTVSENIGFGLRMHKVGRSEAADRVATALDLVRLRGVGDRFPRQLSGGQQQRVALARAIVIEPKVLLLDEPLSNLDAKLRKEMQLELRALQRRLGITAVYVTHDQEEALTLSDRIAIMETGRVAQCAGPNDIYRRPANRFVAEFIGRVNLIRGSLEQRGGISVYRTEHGAVFAVPRNLLQLADSQEPLNLVLRPESVQLDPLGSVREGGIRTKGRILQAIYSGSVTSYEVEVGGGLRLRAEEQNTLGTSRHREGDEVEVYVDPAAISGALAD
jgi:putative spermidine/putrescine transport system ATP-binding protein